MSEITGHSSSLPEASIYRELASQIYKDFVSCGAEIRFEEKPQGPWEASLRAVVAAAVKQLMRENRNLLMKIVYRVDIPEARLGRAIENMTADEASEQLTDLIIAREKQKIYLRRIL